MQAQRKGRRARRGAVLAWKLAMVACLAAASTVTALERDRAASQYLRDEWSSARGYPGGAVHAIAQSRDGYLWIAAERGLVRFDGLKFELLEEAPAATGGVTSVFGVVADPDGGIWARTPAPALFSVRNGAQTDLFQRHDLRPSPVTAMTTGRDGAVVTFSSPNGLLSYREGRFTRLVEGPVLPDRIVLAMAQASGGDWWLGTRDGGIFHLDAGQLTRVDLGLPDVKINCLAVGPRDALWIGTDSGVVRLANGVAHRLNLPASASQARALAMTRDRDDNIWIAAGTHGLLRVGPDGQVSHPARDWREDGSVTAVFEDREGSLWIGTSKGIERWRDGVFTAFAGVHLATDRVGPIHVDAAQRTWFAPAQGGLQWLDGDQVTTVPLPGLIDDVVYSIASRGNDVWVGRQRGGLTRFRHTEAAFTARTFTRRDGLAQDSVYAVHVARDGTLWAGTLSGGISRYSSGVFTTFTTADGLAANTISAIDDGPDGAVWVGTPKGVSQWRSNQRWRIFTAADGLPSADVQTLLVDSTGDVWIGTSEGLALIRGGRVQVRREPAALAGSILGLVEDRDGWLWFTTTSRVMRVRRDRLAAGAIGPGDFHDYDTTDGLISREGVKRHRTVVADGRGHVWLAVNGAIQQANPRSAEQPPALVQIEAVTADDRVLPSADVYEIPSGGHRVTLTYAGLSLAMPERVRFRYRLDGLDRDWSAEVTTRQAIYSNLAPGTYTFRVVASNRDGVWNGQPATVVFHVAPMFWQTRWFQAGAVLLTAAAGWGAYRWRLRQIARRLNSRFEERLAERTRLAQELHDTLLQGVLSVSMRLHLAIDDVPAESSARASLEDVTSLMARVVDEGRDAVRGLRTPAGDRDDLERALARVPQDFGTHPATCRVVVLGSPQPMHPLIRDEVYRIGREALVNALRHAGAHEIEVTVDYQASHVCLTVCDDGCGIDEEILQRGRANHWGLSGMRERANAIGARVRVWSRRDGGTQVELTVPNDIAFTGRHRPAWRRVWSSWWTSSVETTPFGVERK